MRWIAVAATVAALGLVVAGCGGSSSTSSQASPATTTGTSTDTTSAGTTSTSTTSTGTTSTGVTSTTPGGLPVGLTGQCADLAQAGQKFAAAVAASAGGAGGDLQQTANAFNAFVKAAPAELRNDFAVLADAFNRYAAALKGVNLKAGQAPSPAQIAKLLQYGKSLGTGQVQKASADLGAWSRKHCGHP